MIGRHWILSTALLVFLQATLAADLAVDTTVLEAEQERVDAIAKASRAAVSVFAAGKAAGGGSGVVISPDGYALTNFHVTKPCGEHMKCSMNNGELYDAVIVGIDPTGDVALIKLLGRDDFPTAEMGDSDDLEVGQWCFAVGNPFLLATDFEPTVTYGIVSGVHRYQYPAGTLLEYADCIQTDAAINPGNSGGPLFNSRGQLVGINGRGSFEKRGRVNVGVGYAISINQIKHFLGHLKSGRIVDHATLGASVGSDEDGSVVVTNILESSDAYRRGLRYGDQVLAFAGRRIDTVNGFKNVLGIFPKGWRVPLTYRREGQQYDTLVRLAGVHTTDELIRKTQQRNIAPPAPRPKPEDDDEQKEDKPGELPIPRIQLPKNPAKPPLPQEVKAVLELRRGFANYHFNKANRTRVWQTLRDKSDFESNPSSWTISGKIDQQGSLAVTLDDAQLFVQMNTPQGSIESLIDMTQNLETQLEPPGSGGLLVALHLWRYLLTHGPSDFGELYYLGTAPWPDHEEPADVLVGTHDVIECRFYVDTDTGLLIGMEMYPDADVDPCEIDFGEYREQDGRQIPFQLNVRFGDQQYGVIKLDDFQMVAPAGDDA